MTDWSVKNDGWLGGNYNYLEVRGEIFLIFLFQH